MRFLIKNICPVVFTVITFILVNTNISYGVDAFDKYAKIKIGIHSRVELEEFARLGISLEQFNGKFEQDAELIVNYHELDLLRGIGKSPEVLIPDMREYYKNRTQPSEAQMQVGSDLMNKDNIEGFSLGTMGGFHVRDEHIAILNYFKITYPNIVSDLIPIGQSTNGIPIYAQRISDNPNVQESGEGNVYFDGLIHAREPMAGEVLLYYMYWLVENYNTDPIAEYLINNRQIYIVTVLNPDGYVYNQTTDPTGGGMWRKNRRNNGGSYGVDLNRNYGYQWGYDNTGSSPTPSDNTYRGPSAFSEPESQAARDFISAVNPSIGFNCHTAYGVFINPYGYSGVPIAYEYYSEFAGDFAHHMNYPYGTVTEMLWYPSNGTARDWMHHDALCYTWVPEIGEPNEFWPTQNRIIPLASQFMPVLKYITWVSGNYADYQKFQILEGEAIPGDTISLVIDVKNKGLSLDAAPVEINVTSLNNLATGLTTSTVIDTIKSWEIKNNSTNPIKFIVDQSAVVMDELSFNIDIRQNNILTSSETISILVGEQNVLFSDEGNNGFMNWTNSGAGEQWDTTFVSYFSKWHSFSDSRYGSYSNNTMNFCTTVNTTNLNETEYPRLEFAARWALESDYDYTRIQISTNGGTSWTSLTGIHTISVNGESGYTNISDGWAQESINLSSYIGQQVKFRFRLSSDGGLNTDGFYFDDFKVVDYKTPIINSVISDNKFPNEFKLKQNYPNPFNPSTTIEYTLPEQSLVEITVFNTLGKKIKTLFNQQQGPGEKQVHWNGLNEENIPVVSGLYFIKIKAQSNKESFRDVKKCILLR